jgi:hypothetical protein
MREREIKIGELSEAEATLRLIAKLPAPEGLAERVQSGLGAGSKDARVVQWPVAAESSHGWMTGWVRGAAAAAIVCVVAGGAWQISARMGTAGGGNATAAPVRVRSAGGFSSAGAMRTPETLNGPILTNQGLTKKPQAKEPQTKESRSGDAAGAVSNAATKKKKKGNATGKPAETGPR